MITVKIVQIGTAVTEVTLEDNATVGDALAAYGKPIPEGATYSINGTSADVGESVSDGDSLIIAKGAKGAQ